MRDVATAVVGHAELWHSPTRYKAVTARSFERISMEGEGGSICAKSA